MKLGGWTFQPFSVKKIAMARFLTNKQRKKLLDEHRSTRDRKIADRIKAILLADDGESFPQIAKFLLIDEQTVRRHLRDYLIDHKTGNDSGGSGGQLGPEKEAALAAAIDEQIIPTARAAVDIARRLLGADFSVSGMTALLHRLGFSHKKCEGMPAKADPAAQAEFRAKMLKLLDSLPEHEVALFFDASHPTISTKLTHSWSRKGARKIVQTTGARTRVNVVGSLEPATLRMVSTFPDQVNSETVEEHLKAIRRVYPAGLYSVVHLILDQGSYCVSKDTREAAAELGIQLWHLPPYSPNLNLIERAWKVMNEQVRNNVYFADANSFESAIKDFFRIKWKSLRKELAERFALDFQIFPTPSF
jgi:transposase